mgnify:CR=1 FL=1
MSNSFGVTHTVLQCLQIWKTGMILKEFATELCNGLICNFWTDWTQQNWQAFSSSKKGVIESEKKKDVKKLNKQGKNRVLCNSAFEPKFKFHPLSTHPIKCFVPSVRVSTFLSHNRREVKGHLVTESVPQVSRWINLFLAINDILLLKDKQANRRWANAWRFVPWTSGRCAPACGLRSEPCNDQVLR